MPHITPIFIQIINNTSPIVSNFLTDTIVHHFLDIYSQKKYVSKPTIPEMEQSLPKKTLILYTKDKQIPLRLLSTGLQCINLVSCWCFDIFKFTNTGGIRYATTTTCSMYQ